MTCASLGSTSSSAKITLMSLSFTKSTNSAISAADASESGATAAKCHYLETVSVSKIRECVMERDKGIFAT